MNFAGMNVADAAEEVDRRRRESLFPGWPDMVAKDLEARGVYEVARRAEQRGYLFVMKNGRQFLVFDSIAEDTRPDAIGELLGAQIARARDAGPL